MLEHGTEEMYRKELRLHRAGKGLEPCAPCREGHAQHMAEYRQSKVRDRSTETRNMTIKRRALVLLSEEYPERFAELLATERSRVRS